MIRMQVQNPYMDETYEVDNTLERWMNFLQNKQLGNEEFCLFEIRNLKKADKIPAKEFKSTIGIERNVKNKIMRKL